MAQKIQDVKGYNINCFYYEPCPICFGCRNYGFHIFCDSRCGGDVKTNVCTSTLHNPKNFEKIITRPRVILDE
jgi:hypothetical protein